MEGSAYYGETRADRLQTERTVTRLLHVLGVPAHIRGYLFLREAILVSMDDAEMIRAITKQLYPAIARKYKTTPSCVEKAIRRAIETAWDRGRPEMMERIFGYTIEMNRGKPTNAEFIALVADCVRLDFSW